MNRSIARFDARGWLNATLGVGAVTVLLPLATFLVAVWLLGWQLQHVESGSMSPTYPVGSLLVTADVAASDVEIGMPIVFEDPRERGRLVTHRVVAMASDSDLTFVTRGDANVTNDPIPIPARLIRGRVLWHVTLIGALLDWLQWPRSFLLLVVVPAALLLVVEWRSRREVESSAQAPHAGVTELANARGRLGTANRIGDLGERADLVGDDVHDR